MKNTAKEAMTILGVFEKIVEKLITFLTEKGYTYKEDGALWFKSSEYGDDKDRVLILLVISGG